MSDYLIKKGDTLSAIAKKFSTTVSALAKANNIKNVNKIYAGKTLVIPGTTPAPTPVATLPVETSTPVDSGSSQSTLPQTPAPPQPNASNFGVVKTPGRDVTNLANLSPAESPETITNLLFENFSAVELSQVLTSNTIDGIDQQYSIISNLSEVRKRYNATKELTITDKLAPISGVFAIDINSKIPGVNYLNKNNLYTTYNYINRSGSVVYVEKWFIYIDSNGDLVIKSFFYCNSLLYFICKKKLDIYTWMVKIEAELSLSIMILEWTILFNFVFIILCIMII